MNISASLGNIYEYKKLPIGQCNSPDIIQQKMNELFNGLDYVRTYIDDLLIICNKLLEDHIKKLDKALNKLKSDGFKVNAEMCFHARIGMPRCQNN